jgi:hypothetical protein
MIIGVSSWVYQRLDRNVTMMNLNQEINLLFVFLFCVTRKSYYINIDISYAISVGTICSSNFTIDFLLFIMNGKLL